jgi:hypothetical protein
MKAFFCFETEVSINVKKVSLSLCAIRRHIGKRLQIHLFLTLALDKGKWSSSRPPALFLGKGPQYQLNRRLGGPRKNLDFFRTENLPLFYSRLLEVSYGLQNLYHGVQTLCMFFLGFILISSSLHLVIRNERFYSDLLKMVQDITYLCPPCGSHIPSFLFSFICSPC